MGFFEEYALLIAVALPVGVIAFINLLLYLGGERGTLLLPGVRDFPRVAIEPPAGPEARPAEVARPAVQTFEDQEVAELKEAA